MFANGIADGIDVFGGGLQRFVDGNAIFVVFDAGVF